MSASDPIPNVPFRILSLDGGGAKGFYSLGVLREIEGMVGKPLHEAFDLVFGTSTGAIIASLISLGYSVDEIHTLYREHVPRIMQRKTPSEKSRALAELATEVFGEVDLHRFCSGLLRAILAIKETGYGSNTQR